MPLTKESGATGVVWNRAATSMPLLTSVESSLVRWNGEGWRGMQRDAKGCARKWRGMDSNVGVPTGMGSLSFVNYYYYTALQYL